MPNTMHFTETIRDGVVRFQRRAHSDGTTVIFVPDRSGTKLEEGGRWEIGSQRAIHRSGNNKFWIVAVELIRPFVSTRAFRRRVTKGDEEAQATLAEREGVLEQAA